MKYIDIENVKLNLENNYFGKFTQPGYWHFNRKHVCILQKAKYLQDTKNEPFRQTI